MADTDEYDYYLEMTLQPPLLREVVDLAPAATPMRHRANHGATETLCGLSTESFLPDTDVVHQPCPICFLAGEE